MRRNLYPFAGANPNNPGHEVAARFDLMPGPPGAAVPNGAIDAKVINHCLIKTGIVQVGLMTRVK